MRFIEQLWNSCKPLVVIKNRGKILITFFVFFNLLFPLDFLVLLSSIPCNLFWYWSSCNSSCYCFCSRRYISPSYFFLFSASCWCCNWWSWISCIHLLSCSSCHRHSSSCFCNWWSCASIQSSLSMNLSCGKFALLSSQLLFAVKIDVWVGSGKEIMVKVTTLLLIHVERKWRWMVVFIHGVWIQKIHGDRLKKARIVKKRKIIYHGCDTNGCKKDRTMYLNTIIIFINEQKTPSFQTHEAYSPTKMVFLKYTPPLYMPQNSHDDS